MLISIVFQVANLPTTGTAVLAELINWLPPNHHLSRLLAEIQACLQPDPCVPYPVILWTHQLIPTQFQLANHCPITFCWHLSHATDIPDGILPTTSNSFGKDNHPNSTGSSRAKPGRGHPLTSLKSQTTASSVVEEQHPSYSQMTWPPWKKSPRHVHWPIAVITNIHPHQMASCVWYT